MSGYQELGGEGMGIVCLLGMEFVFWMMKMF